MLINEEPQWNGLVEDDLRMFPELGTLEEECALPADDFLEALSSDLEIPLLLSDEGSPSYDESPDEIMKNALVSQAMHTLDDVNFGFAQIDDKPDELAEYFSTDKKTNSIKMEPKSPFTQLPPSPSPSQSESSSGSEWQTETCSITQTDAKFALETPPISPPQNESPPISPPPAQNNPSLLQQVKLLPLNSLNLKECAKQKFILSDNNPAKRICIQPKLENSTKETPRKTIVLSAQDFAALTQRVKQNIGNQPLKVQALPMSKHVKIQNQLNQLPIQQTKTSITAATLTQNNPIKVVNSLPNLQVHTKTPTIAIPSKPVTKKETTQVSSIIVKKESSKCPSILIKNDVPICPPIVIKKENPNCTPIIIKNEFPEFIDFNDRQDSEIKALKRQQRMIKNRESACLSRKKKKEYVTSLENQISDLQEQNRLLQAENTELKQRLSEIAESSGKRFGSKNYGVNKKNTAILLAMVFMVSLNFGGFGGVLNQNRQPLGDVQSHVPSVSLPNVRHGRTLLWSQSEEQENGKKRFNDTLPSHHPMCPMHINRTESIRLDFELRRWIGGDPNRDNWTKPSKTDLEIKSLNELLNLRTYPLKDESTVNNLRISSRRATNRARNKQINDIPSPSNINAVQVFSPLLREHAKLFDALKRRDDTFYVVWFSGEHLLLPASRKNSTIRPKMSLVLPAVPVNESYYSTPPNHVTMMQIDCEVTNTQLLHLQESVIPKHLRNEPQTDSSTSAKKRVMSENAPNITKNYKPYFLKDDSLNSLSNNNLKRSYATEDKNVYDGKKAFFAKGFQLEGDKYNTFIDKNPKNINRFMNETEEVKKLIYLQDKRIFRRKLKRSTMQ